MKIEKGYTLSQFIGLLKKDNQTYGDWARNYALIVQYYELYNKPLTKEMFVNEIKEPIDVCFNESDEISFGIDWNNYIDAETKVIFKVKSIETNTKDSILIGLNTGHWFYFENNKFTSYGDVFETIGELFDYFNGDIELQNVEL